MGQRHQIYVALPPCYLCNGTGQRTDGMKVPDGCNGCAGKGWRGGVKVVGLHHQWLYGMTAIKQAARALAFMRADAGERHGKIAGGYSDASEVFSAIYSCIPEEGYFHGVHKLDNGETEDPRRGDNNDGITILDAREIASGKIRYAFMSLDNATEGEKSLPKFRPVDARTYVDSYYPVGSERRKPEIDEEIGKILAGLDAHKAEVLTRDQVAEIFPKLRGKLTPRKRAPKLARKPSDGPLL